MLKKIKDKVSAVIKDERILLNVIWVVLAILLGTVVRFNFISGTDFPINDGGLFYQMVEDLLENELVIPEYTIYNQDQIPFAYPPLAFYLVAFLNILTKISLFSLLRYVPALISIITIIAFYWLVREVFEDQLMAGISTVLFAVVPRAFEWFVMGGGITRSLGFFFAILAIQSIWRMYTEQEDKKAIIRAAIFSGLTVLSHPETGLFVVFTAIALIIYHGITKTKIKNSLLVALGVVLIISPWIINVVNNHGLHPFTSAGGTGHQQWFEIKNFITFKFGFENGEFISVYSVLALSAVFLRRDKFTWTLFGLLVIGYLFFPRSGPNLLTIWASMLAAIGLSEVLVYAAKEQPGAKDLSMVIEADGKAKIILIAVIIYAFFGAYTYKYIYGKDSLHLTDEIHDAFIWIADNTEEDAKFLLYPSITENRYWWNDYLSEWFPVIANRRSVSTVQGYEWIPELFEQKVLAYAYLRSCGKPGPDCVDDWERDNVLDIDYLVIDTEDNRPDFINSFEIDDNYELYNNRGRLVIFKKK